MSVPEAKAKKVKIAFLLQFCFLVTTPGPTPKKRKKEKKLSRSAPLSYKGTLPAAGISSSQGCHTHPAGQSRSAVPALSHCPGPLRTKAGAGGGDLLLTVFPVSTPLRALPLPPQAEGSPSLRFASVQLRAQALFLVVRS